MGYYLEEKCHLEYVDLDLNLIFRFIFEGVYEKQLVQPFYMQWRSAQNSRWTLVNFRPNRVFDRTVWIHAGHLFQAMEY